MTSKSFLIILIVVVAAIALGAAVWYPRETTEETTSPAPLLSSPAINQFIQQEPLTSPADVVVPTAEAATPPASPAAAAGETMTVSISDTGFTPAELTVAAGTTVVFINNGQAAHWPASANHPTHEVLPEFDAQRGLATGETYAHTFTEVGTWALHDHLFPRQTASITVQ